MTWVEVICTAVAAALFIYIGAHLLFELNKPNEFKPCSEHKEVKCGD